MTQQLRCQLTSGWHVYRGRAAAWPEAEFARRMPTGEVVDGHLRLKAARKLGITDVPVILCDEWTPAQVKAFRLMVNRSVAWADWDETLLALELQELKESDFDLSLSGFDPGEIDSLLALEDDERANATPPLPESPVSRPGDLWLLGPQSADLDLIRWFVVLRVGCRGTQLA